MRRFILYLVILFVAVWIGLKIAEDPGYLLLAYRKWTVEMPFWFAVICLVILFWIFYLFMRFTRTIWTLPARLQHRAERRHAQKSQDLTNKGLFALAAGDWGTARKKFLKATTHTKMPWFQYLAAAFAANKLRAYEYCDAYLNKALAVNPNSKVAIALARSQFNFEQQPEQAMLTLQYLREEAPKQPYVLRLLAQTYEKIEDWQGLLELLPTLRKHKVLTQKDLVNLEVQSYSGFLQTTGEQSDLKTVQKAWRKIPYGLNHNPTLISTYIHVLLAKGANKEAEDFLAKTLTDVWDDNLLILYGDITSSKPARQLALAESWLNHHKNDATLLFVLGKLTLRSQLWGKARTYFEASLNVEPRPNTYYELGKLLERLDEERWTIVNCYKAGLQLANSSSQ